MRANTILVPIDFSDHSRRALAEADTIASNLGTNLVLLHVYPVTQAAVLDFTYVEPPESIARATAKAQEHLETWTKGLKSPRHRITLEVMTGNPVSAINERAKTVDLVVIATHGRTGLEHFLMGSVAERVVQGSAANVLVVKKG